MTSWITICETCKCEGWNGEVTDGERFAALIEAAAVDVPGVQTRRHACLMGCAGACNVAVQGPGKIAYTLGRFSPTKEAADGIVAYAALHAQSETGQVPYRQWPEAVKGHFVTRHLPLPDTP